MFHLYIFNYHVPSYYLINDMSLKANHIPWIIAYNYWSNYWLYTDHSMYTYTKKNLPAILPWIFHPFWPPQGQPPLPQLRGRRWQQRGHRGASLHLGRRQRVGPGGTATAAGGHNAEPGGWKFWSIFSWGPVPVHILSYIKYLYIYILIYIYYYYYYYYFYYYYYYITYFYVHTYYMYVHTAW